MTSTVSHELVLDADLEELRQLGSWLESILVGRTQWWPGTERPAIIGEMELAIHEIAMNSVRYAESSDGKVVIRAEVGATTCEVRIIDHGVEVDPDEIPTPDPDVPQVGGYGLMIVRQLTSHFAYSRVDAQNTWLLVFDAPTA